MRMRAALVCATRMLVVMTVLVPHAAAASDSSDGAQIRLNSPFAAPVHRADIDASGDFAVVSGVDNALTLWPLADPAAHRLERVPIEQDQSKRAHAVAISPDASLIAYSKPPLLEADGSFATRRATIYIIERLPKGGRRIVKRLHENGDDLVTRPQAMKFSPDGRFLAAGLSSSCGVRVWRTSDWTPVFKDDLGYGSADPKHQGEDTCCRSGDPGVCDRQPDTNALAFLSSDNKTSALLISADTGLRSYEVTDAGSFARARFIPPDALGLEKPAGLALDAGQKALAVGDERVRAMEQLATEAPIRFRVALLDPYTLSSLRPAPIEIGAADFHPDFLPEVWDETMNVAAQASLDRVAWLENGRGMFLVAAGVFPCAIANPDRIVGGRTFDPKETCIARWKIGDEAAGATFIPFTTDRVADVLAIPRTDAILAVSQRRIASMDENGAIVTRPNGLPLDETSGFADFRDLADTDLDFKISPDATVVEFQPYPVDGAPERITFDLRRDAIEVHEGDSGGAAILDVREDPKGEVVAAGWRNQIALPHVKGAVPVGTVFGTEEVVRSLALVPRRPRLVMGSSEALRVIDYRDARPRVVCEHRLREDAYRVNVTETGSLIVSAHSDGTLRWYRVDERAGGECRLSPILSATLWRRPDGSWSHTTWIPAGPRKGTFSGDLRDKSMLQWQCPVGDSDVSVTEFDRMIPLISAPAIFAALEPHDKSVTEPTATHEDLISCASSSGLSSKAQKRTAIEIDRPREPKVDGEHLPLHLWLDPEAEWPKRLTIKNQFGEALDIALGSAHHAGRAGAEISREIAGESGLVEVVVTLSPLMRRERGQSSALTLALDGEPLLSKAIQWAGDAQTTKLKRRLWAIIVGMSAHDAGPAMNLRFAGNDAVDLASVFLRDYKARVLDKSSSSPADFDALAVKLIVSPYDDEGEREVQRLVGSYPGQITVFSPTVGGINSALLSVRQGIAQSPGYDDVFLFHFSGHGMISPAGDRSDSLFATISTPAAADEAQLTQTTLSSSSLLAQISGISAQKIIVLDACRVLPSSVVMQFDPERFLRQFRQGDFDASFFFGSSILNPSVEIESVGFDMTRESARVGNGLFTYAFLKALSTRPLAHDRGKPFNVDTPRVRSYLQNFFDIDKADSEIHTLLPLIKSRFPPKPTPIQSRNAPSNETLRTLDPID